ncbi:MAG TPA: hypothetical protein VLC97_15355, partial [Rhodanobacteraceae bacterium]|nr:hypothetical protein [Rhodanobacteraceae bacterium]
MTDEPRSLGRRAALQRLALAATLPACATLAPVFSTSAVAAATRSSANAGRLKQSVCRWPYKNVPLPEFCKRAKQLGLVAIDLLYPDEWSVATDAGLVVSMGYA